VLVLKIAVSALLVAFVAWRLRRGERLGQMGGALRDAAVPWLAVAFLFHITGVFVASLRWRVLLDAQGMRIPFASLVNSYLVAAFFNNVLPGMYGGDLVRAYDSTKHTGETTRSITVVVLGRLAGLVALVGIAVVAMALNWRDVRARIDDVCPLLWFLAALIVGVLVLGALTVPGVARVLVRLLGRGPLKGVLTKVLAALTAYRNRPRHTLAILGLSVAFQLNVVLYYFICTRALGFRLPLYRVMMGVPVVLVLMMVIPSVNSIGVRTLGFGAFLFPGMAGPVSAAAAAASLEIVDLILRLAFGLVGGGVFILRRRRPRRTQRERSTP